MYSTKEATKERVAAYLEALEAEKDQLDVAIEQSKASGDSKRIKRLEQRLEANAAEIARVSGTELEKPLEKWTVEELDEAYGEVEGYPASAKKAEKVAFAKGHAEATEDDAAGGE